MVSRGHHGHPWGSGPVKPGLSKMVNFPFPSSPCPYQCSCFPWKLQEQWRCALPLNHTVTIAKSQPQSSSLPSCMPCQRCWCWSPWNPWPMLPCNCHSWDLQGNWLQQRGQGLLENGPNPACESDFARLWITPNHDGV